MEGSRPIQSDSTADLADSDDVSALSMAGASVIAYRAQLIQNQQVEIDATIHEGDAEHDVADEGGGPNRLSSLGTSNSPGKSKNSSPHRRQSITTTPVHPHTNREAIVFADDHQLLERHKKKKKKKSRRHHKKDRHNKDYINVIQYEMSLPINEICFPTIDGPSAAGDSHGYESRPPASSGKGSQSNPSVASTAESTGSRYIRRESLQTSHSGSGVHYNEFVINTFRPQHQDLPDIPQSNSNRSSFVSQHSSSMQDNLSHQSENLKSPSRSSFRSICSSQSLAHKSHLSGHGSFANRSHFSGYDSVSNRSHLSGHQSLAQRSHLSGFDSTLRSHISNASFSHVTVKDVEVIINELESAKIEEMKVLELHSKLEAEILELIEKVEAMEENRLKVVSELKMASRERERLQSKLNSVLDDNMKLNSRLQNMEDQEDEKRLDDVLDGMQAKMRALRLKSVRKGKDPSIRCDELTNFATH
ncbi:hypothetical protein ACHAWO_003769 [Cyclotella atomus]|uniref:Uncharacterized protein n=1 Tax=Cyclotella atomus TaxID=382360 RepID=A0ABD3NER3_9STRA